MDAVYIFISTQIQFYITMDLFIVFHNNQLYIFIRGII